MLHTILLPVFLFVATTLTAQTTISGHLSNTDGWSNTIYLRAITDYKSLFASTTMYLAANAEIDDDGHFTISLESLPCTDCLYRLDLPPEGGPAASLFFGSSKENFAFFDLLSGEQLVVSANADQLLKTFRVKAEGPTWTYAKIREVREPFYAVADDISRQFSNASSLVGKNIDSLQLAAMDRLVKSSEETNINLLKLMSSSDNVYDKIVGLTTYNYDNTLANHLEVYEKTLAELSLLAPDHSYTSQLRFTLEENVRKLQVGDQVPDILLPDPDGNAQHLFAATDGLILLDFWASWCSPCRLENRTAVAPLFKKFSGQGFSVYSVSIDNKKEPWLAAIEKDGMAWTNVSDLVGLDSPAAKQFDVSTIPATFLIDAATKTILARDLRGEQLKRYIENHFAR